MSNGTEQGGPVDDVRDLVTPADNAEPVAARATATPETAPVVAETKKEEPKIGTPFENNRQKAIDAYRRAREPQEGAEFAAMPDDVERSRVGDKVETRADREARREEERNPKPIEAPPAEETATQVQQRSDEPVVVKRKLKVNGREVELSESEIDRLAQQAYAAGDILARAKREREDLRNLLELTRSNVANHSAPAEGQQKTQQSTSEDTKPDDAELDDAIDRIQVGDRNEAKEALAKLLKKHGETVVDRRLAERVGNLDERIEETIRVREENQRRQERTREVWSEFVKEETAFANDDDLQLALANKTTKMMRDEMLNIGIDSEILDRAQRQNGLTEAQVVGTAYRELQKQGYSLPDHGDILKRSARVLRDSFGMAAPKPNPAPQPQPVIDTASRIDRKRVIASQPRAASNQSLEAPPTTREDKMRQAAQQMRAARRGR